MTKKQKIIMTNKVEKSIQNITFWVGTPVSIGIHTLFFILAFLLLFFGVNFNLILLVVTTIVSLEAIYLSLFIQMTVNQHTASLKNVEEDIEDIQEDVEDIQEDVEDVGEDIDMIQLDEKEEEAQETKDERIFLTIENHLDQLGQDMIQLQQEIQTLKHRPNQ